jgi:hypothetical protein
MFNHGIRPGASSAGGASTPSSTPPSTPTTSSPSLEPPESPSPPVPISPDLAGLPRRGTVAQPPTKRPRLEVPDAVLARMRAWVNSGHPDERREDAAAVVLHNMGSPFTFALQLDTLELRELPPCLDALPQLRILQVRENTLSDPPDLSALPQLDVLGLALNQLTMAPDLRAQTRLRVLSLEENELTTPPDLGPLGLLKSLDLSGNRIGVPPCLGPSTLLESVDLSDNDLVAMPDVRGLANLRDLDLSYNLLATVPRWIGELPDTLDINLTGNPLGAETIALLRGLRSGPRIHYGVEAPLDEGPPASLSEQVGLWLSSRLAMTTAQRRSLEKRWADFETEPHASQFARLLRELTRTADFQNSATSREALGQRVAEVLDALARDPALRQPCFAVAHEGLGTCGDRVALAFSDIEAAARAPALAGRPDELLKLAQGLHRLARVDEIARADLSARRGGIDEVEVVLAYRVKLAEPLGLPAQPAHMLFECCANLDAAQLAQAERDVLDGERMEPDALVAFIARQPFWQASLQQQPTCAEAIGQLLERRERQVEALHEANDAPGAALGSAEYEERYRQIGSEHAKELQKLFIRFTRDAMDKVAAGAHGTLPSAPSVPAHVRTVTELRDIAMRIQGLRQPAQREEARSLAGTLLQPRRVAALHGTPASRMGAQEARAMDLADAQYMDLLRTLVADGLLDARAVFDVLRGVGMARGDTPYLMHIASRAGAGQADMPGAVQLAHAVTQLLDTLARAREQAGEKNVRAGMREALLTQAHRQQTGELARARYGKYVDFYARLLLSGSPSTPGAASLAAARALRAADLLPARAELRAADLSNARADKFAEVEHRANQASRPSAAPSARLEEVVQAMRQLDVAAARAADAQARERELARRREEDARVSLYEAVRGALDDQWESMARRTRKALAPSGLSTLLEPVGASARADAARSLPRTAPAELVAKVFRALMPTPEGQAVLRGLAETGQDYRARHHPGFESLLKTMVGVEVAGALMRRDSGLRMNVRTTIAASDARDEAVRNERRRAADAAMDDATRQVHANANRPGAAGGESGGLQAERTIRWNREPVAHSDPAPYWQPREGDEDLVRSLPSVPDHDPVHTAWRHVDEERDPS